MKNRELYVKDPGQLRLLNNGVAEVAEVDSDDLRRTLRFELETFVCEGEYEKGPQSHPGDVPDESWTARAAGGLDQWILWLRQVAPGEDAAAPVGRFLLP